ncbi:MAG: MFS transporter [Spirochaetes bacterium]|jgi:fucose permease|nr:MFS transporter [Spirochaetota bacterium]
MKKRDLLLVFTAYLLQFFLGINIAIRGYLLPEISRDFSINYQTSGIMFLVPLIPALTGAFFGGYLYKMFNRKLILICGTLLLTLLQVALAVSPSYPVFLSVSFFLGFATLITILGSHIGISAFFHTHAYRFRESSIHLLHFFFGAGAITALLTTKRILDFSGSWRYVYLTFSTLSMLIVVLFIFSAFPNNNNKAEKVETNSAGKPKFRLPLIASKLMLFYAISAICYVGLEFSIINWAPTFLEIFLGKDKEHVSSVMVFFFALFTGGRLISAVLSHHIRQDKLFAILSIATLLTIVPAFIYPISFYGHYIFIPLTGLTLSGLFPILQNSVIRRHTGEIDLATGTLFASTNFGASLLPFLAGTLSEHLGLSRGLYLLPFLAVLLIIAYYRSEKL